MGTYSEGVMGAWRDPFLKVLRHLEEARNALTPWTPGSRHQAVGAAQELAAKSVVSLLLLVLALPYKTSALSSLQNDSLCICLPALSAPRVGCGWGESGGRTWLQCGHACVHVRRVSTPTEGWKCRPMCVWEPGLGEHWTLALLPGAPGDHELPPPAPVRIPKTSSSNQQITPCRFSPVRHLSPQHPRARLSTRRI